MTQKPFGDIIKSDTLNVICFYSRKLNQEDKVQPQLEKLVDNYTSNIILTKINVDNNNVLRKALKITSTPAICQKNKLKYRTYKEENKIIEIKNIIDLYI